MLSILSLIFCFCAGIPCWNFCFQRIIDVHSITEIQSHIEQYVPNSLVLIDIDDTLLIAQDKIIRNANIQSMKQFLQKLKSHADYDILKNILYTTVQYQLVEPEWSNLVNDLKRTAYAVYGFTARRAGPFILECSGADWTRDSLANLGVSFSSHKPLFPHFQHGILFCYRASKGSVLKEFLLHSCAYKHIDTIILIDDRLYNHENVAHEIEIFNKTHNDCQLSFLGIHYKAADLFDHTLDQDVVEKQLETLITDKRYISQEEAKQLITSQN